MPIGLPEINVSPGLKPQGQSNAKIASPTHRATRIAGMGKAPPTPDHIAVTNEQSSLVYPSDRPRYFMQFGIYDYARTSLMEMGTLEPWKGGSNQICLPLSEGLTDTSTARWEETPIGWITGGIAESIKGVAQAEDATEASKRKAIEGANAIIAAGRMTPLEFAQQSPYFQRLALDIPAGVGSSIGALTGIAPNRFITILYIGPEYKQHSFSWNLSPRNKEESETLRRIVNVFKKAMSPTIRHHVLWGYPCVFRVMFRPNNEQLYKYRPMVIKRFSANWAPMGRASFYNTRTPTLESFYGAPEEGNPPEGCTIQLSMVELEYWTQEKMSETPARATQLDQSADW